MVSTEQVKSKLQLLDKMKQHQRASELPVPRRPFHYQIVCDDTNNPDIERDTVTVDLFIQYHDPNGEPSIHYREESVPPAPGGSITRAAVKAAVEFNLWAVVMDTHMRNDRARVEVMAEDLSRMMPRSAVDDELRLRASVDTYRMGAHQSDSHLSIRFAYGACYCVYESDPGIIINPNFYGAVEKAALAVFTPRVLFHLRRR